MRSKKVSNGQVSSQFTEWINRWWSRSMKEEQLYYDYEPNFQPPSLDKTVSPVTCTTSICDANVSSCHILPKTSSLSTLRTINSIYSDASSRSSLRKELVSCSKDARLNFYLDDFDLENDEPFVQMESITEDMFISELATVNESGCVS